MMEGNSENQQKNESSPVDTAPSLADSSALKSPKSPVEKEERRMPEHDSMVTVRLSEPPSLSVNTDLPLNPLPFRKSIWGHECTPTSATAPSVPPVMEVEEGDMEDVQVHDLKSPTSPKSPLKDIQATTTIQEEKEIEDDLMEDSDTEEVNWDQLQKTEDEEVKDQDDNVCCMPS